MYVGTGDREESYLAIGMITPAVLIYIIRDLGGQRGQIALCVAVVVAIGFIRRRLPSLARAEPDQATPTNLDVRGLVAGKLVVRPERSLWGIC